MRHSWEGLGFERVAVEETFSVTVPLHLVEGVSHPLRRRVKIKRLARVHVREIDNRYDTYTIVEIRSNHCISDETDAYLVKIVARKEL